MVANAETAPDSRKKIDLEGEDIDWGYSVEDDKGVEKGLAF